MENNKKQVSKMGENSEKEKIIEEKEPIEKKTISLRVKKYFRKLFDFSNYDAKTIIYIIIFIFLIGISLYLLYYIIFVDQTFLYRLVIEWFVNPIYILAFWGILLFIAIMAIQGLLVPIPSEIVLLATGIIWGLVGGGIMGIIGSMVAALVCYYISRKGGRPLVEKFIGEKALFLADNFIRKYGMGTIIVARFLPFVAFDPISYVAGLVDLDVKKYSIGTFIGSIPRAFFFSWLGSILFPPGMSFPINLDDIPLAELETYSANFNFILIIILGVLVILFGIYYLLSIYLERKAKKKQDNSNP